MQHDTVIDCRLTGRTVWTALHVSRLERKASLMFKIVLQASASRASRQAVPPRTPTPAAQGHLLVSRGSAPQADVQGQGQSCQQQPVPTQLALPQLRSGANQASSRAPSVAPAIRSHQGAFSPLPQHQPSSYPSASRGPSANEVYGPNSWQPHNTTPLQQHRGHFQVFEPSHQAPPLPPSFQPGAKRPAPATPPTRGSQSPASQLAAQGTELSHDKRRAVSPLPFSLGSAGKDPSAHQAAITPVKQNLQAGIPTEAKRAPPTPSSSAPNQGSSSTQAPTWFVCEHTGCGEVFTSNAEVS